MVKPLPSGELFMQREIPRPGCSYATRQATTIADCCFPAANSSLQHLSPANSVSCPIPCQQYWELPLHSLASVSQLRCQRLQSCNPASGTQQRPHPVMHHWSKLPSLKLPGKRTAGRRVRQEGIPEAACVVQLVDQPIEGKIHGRQAGAPHAYEPHSDCHPPESALTRGPLSTRRTPPQQHQLQAQQQTTSILILDSAPAL